MIIDAQNYFSTAQAVTSTAISENIIDLGVARDMGAGQPVWIVCQVTTAIATESSGTVVVTVVNHSSEPSSGQGTTIMTLGTFTAGSADAGAKLQAILPPCATDLQYLAVQYTVSGVSAGAVDCFLTPTPDNPKFYPDAVTIS